MAKRKGSSPSFKRSPASGSRSRSKAAKEGSKAETSERGVDEKFQQLREEFRPLAEKHAKIWEQECQVDQNLDEQRICSSLPKPEKQRRKLEKQRRKLEEQLRLLRREVEQLQQKWLPKRNILMGVCSELEAENDQRLLDKLPKEVWEKILDNLKSDDLFPLALSCRYFRKKQKELVARTRQDGAPRLAFKTNLKRHLGRPPSADYLRFCSKETVSKKRVWDRDYCIIHLATFHGHLPLLQELLEPLKTLQPHFYEHLATTAGESSSFQSSLLILCFGF